MRGSFCFASRVISHYVGILNFFCTVIALHTSLHFVVVIIYMAYYIHMSYNENFSSKKQNQLQIICYNSP